MYEQTRLTDGSRFIVAEGSGHAVHLDRPRRRRGSLSSSDEEGCRKMKVLVDLVLSNDGIHMRKGGEFDVRKRSDIPLQILPLDQSNQMDTGL